ncbi:deoxyhypusine synthase family protein [candidate division KSB1 bacterium]|nr:deoxyhypusine synthase family protein [candidate division KSB1 bacterium]
MQGLSLFVDLPDIRPVEIKKGVSITELIHLMGATSFEARHVARGAQLYQRMIEGNDTIWLGIAGAGIAGGMGGMVISLIKNGFLDVICSTGAQVYHDLHFAFDLPVKAISPQMDDNLLRRHGDTRIFDIGIREKETLEAQDEIIRRFIVEAYPRLKDRSLSSWEFNYELGLWTTEYAPHPERSFVATAAQDGVPLFWDSLSNHSIAMNLARTDREGYPLAISGQKDVFDSAALTFSLPQTGFVELGGGGPKNFIQQTGPTISQILGIDFEGAERGLQISTAVEREGSLSSCTFGEAVTWGKYKEAREDKLVQIWGEYSIILPLLVAYIIENCSAKSPKHLVAEMPDFIARLDAAR